MSGVRSTSVSSPLEVTGVQKTFAETDAVRGVSLTLDAEEIVAIVGPSGCGKSTLLRMVGGLEGIDTGEIRLGGELVDDGRRRLPPERRSVGLVFQEHALFPHLTVAANVAFGLRGLSGRQADDRVAEMLDVVSLGGYGERYPHELSGGERQRVALARALAPAPALMLFDEPFASLDRNLRDDLRHQIVRALRATGTAALVVTHDQHEALSMGDRIAVMRAGRFVQVGSPNDVFHAPADRFTAGFMGEASFLPVAADGDALVTALGVVEGASGSASVADAVSVAMVRPDDVEFFPHRTTLGQVPDADADTDSVLAPVEVVGREYRGMHWLVSMKLDDGTPLTALTSHLVDPRVGERGVVRLLDGHGQVPLVDG